MKRKILKNFPKNRAWGTTVFFKGAHYYIFLEKISVSSKPVTVIQLKIHILQLVDTKTFRQSRAPNIEFMYETICEPKFAAIMKEEQACLLEVEK